MAVNPNTAVMSYDHPELMPQGLRKNANWELEVYWCFRQLIHEAFDNAPEEVDDRRPLILRRCVDHPKYSKCECKWQNVGLEEARYICRVLEAELDVRIWAGPPSIKLKPRIPHHFWNEERRVKWSLPLRLWEPAQLEDTIAAYLSGNIFSSVPHGSGTRFYQILLEHIRRVTWPDAPESVQARFPRGLLVDDGAGVFYVKYTPDRAAKDELAKIMRGLNEDIWVVNRTSSGSMKDKVKRKIPEMLPVDAVQALTNDIEAGELFVRTSAA